MRERVDGCQVAWIEDCHRQGSVIVLDGADPILESNAFGYHPDNVAGQSYRLRLEADEVSPKVSGIPCEWSTPKLQQFRYSLLKSLL